MLFWLKIKRKLIFMTRNEDLTLTKADIILRVHPTTSNYFSLSFLIIVNNGPGGNTGSHRHQEPEDGTPSTGR